MDFEDRLGVHGSRGMVAEGKFGCTELNSSNFVELTESMNILSFVYGPSRHVLSF